MAKAQVTAEDYSVQENLYYGNSKGSHDIKVTSSEDGTSVHCFIVGRVYRGMETSGKQLLMYFDQKALRNAAECERKVRMMESLDICSPKFSFLRAETDKKHQKICILCDVLMDQAVLPGVGNIIKNEALFYSGLHLALKMD